MGYGKINKEEAIRRNELFKKGIKVCSTCKRELSLINFSKDCSTKCGLSSLCKECQAEQRKRRKDKIEEWKLNNSDKIKNKQREYSLIRADKKKKYNDEHKEYFKLKRKEYENNNLEIVQKQRRKQHTKLTTRYKRYQTGAEERNLSFNLSLEEFDNLTKQNCFYCGEIITNEFGEQINGIDRLDSSIGYESGNVVPSCFICNRMKSNYNLSFWINKMKTIIEHVETNDAFKTVINNLTKETA